MTSQAQERLVDDIIREAFQSVTYQDIGLNILPLLDKLMDSSGSLFYRCNEKGEMRPMAGSFCEVAEQYRDHYIAKDPLQTGLRRVNPMIQRVAILPEWEDYVKGPVYNECTHPNEIDDFFHIILQGDKFHGPGMVGIMLARTTKQTEFTEQDGLLLARVYPSLQALVHRCARLENRLETMPFLETMLELNHPYAVVFNTKGKVYWAAKYASALLNLQRRSKNHAMETLMEAVQRLSALVKKTPSSPPIASVEIPQEAGPPINAELRLIRTLSGEPFIFVELDAPVLSSSFKKISAQFQLTAAETEVLRLLSQGFADRDIAKHLFVTLATVRTHVGRIFAKMGVKSRVQAALLVHGVKSSLSLET